jgi:hypothetical protein
MQHCPICNSEMTKGEVICMSCKEKVITNEPVRKEARIRNVADTLVILLAIFLLCKGAFALLGMSSYKSFIEEMGFPATSDSLFYWNASICIIAALGYAVTAFGNYLNTQWARNAGRNSMLFFILGQLIIQLGDISEQFIMAEAIAVVCFLSFVPVLQFVMCRVSTPSPEAPTHGSP